MAALGGLCNSVALREHSIGKSTVKMQKTHKIPISPCGIFHNLESPFLHGRKNLWMLMIEEPILFLWSRFVQVALCRDNIENRRRLHSWNYTLLVFHKIQFHDQILRDYPMFTTGFCQLVQDGLAMFRREMLKECPDHVAQEGLIFTV